MLLQKKSRSRGKVEEDDLWLDRVAGKSVIDDEVHIPAWLMPDASTEFKIYVGKRPSSGSGSGGSNPNRQ